MTPGHTENILETQYLFIEPQLQAWRDPPAKGLLADIPPPPAVTLALIFSFTFSIRQSPLHTASLTVRSWYTHWNRVKHKIRGKDWNEKNILKGFSHHIHLLPIHRINVCSFAVQQLTKTGAPSAHPFYCTCTVKKGLNRAVVEHAHYRSIQSQWTDEDSRVLHSTIFNPINFEQSKHSEEEQGLGAHILVIMGSQR